MAKMKGFFSCTLLVIFLLPADFYGSSFVGVDGTDFTLDGEPCFFPGANAYFLWYADLDCSSPGTNQGCLIPSLDAAVSLNLKVLRTWGFCNARNKYGFCFQPDDGLYDETTFEHFDHVVKAAADRNLRLIVAFVNYWPDFGGMTVYNDWCNLTERDDFYRSACTKQKYKDYVSYFINRVNSVTGVKYKDDPTIFAWELANEPRCRSDKTGQTLNDWIGEMSAFIESIDPNHLITTGVDGGYLDKGSDPNAWWYKGNEGQDFYANHAWDDIDFATFHFYQSMDESLDPVTWIVEHIEDAHTIIGKPVLFEEFNAKDDQTLTLADWYRVMEENGINADAFWMLVDEEFHNNVDADGYFVFCSEDTDVCEVIREHARTMNDLCYPVQNWMPLVLND